MSVEISDEIIQASRLSPNEFRQEIALYLFQTERLTLGYASQLAQMSPKAFRHLLKQRHIPLYSYVVQYRVVEQLQNEARLDIGESEAIAFAIELGAELLLIDERRGRAEATRLGVRITRLLGILIEAKHQKLITAVKPLMDALIATSEFRVSPALYNQILEMVDEV